MMNTKNGSDLINVNKELKTVETKSQDMPEVKVISAILNNYASQHADLSGLSTEDRKKKESDLEWAVRSFADTLGAKGLQQNMLAVQFLGAHELQQKLFSHALRSIQHPEHNQYYMNAFTKVSNLCAQQLSLLNKLQGNSQQKVVVEHLHIHEGGQAIVGQVHTQKGGGVNE